MRLEEDPAEQDVVLGIPVVPGHSVLEAPEGSVEPPRLEGTLGLIEDHLGVDHVQTLTSLLAGLEACRGRAARGQRRHEKDGAQLRCSAVHLLVLILKERRAVRRGALPDGFVFGPLRPGLSPNRSR